MPTTTRKYLDRGAILKINEMETQGYRVQLIHWVYGGMVYVVFEYEE